MSLHFLERRLAMDIELILKEPLPEDWVRCDDCIHRGDCEACGLDEGCYFGEPDSIVHSYHNDSDDEDYLHWFD